jgi:SSS family solute:Na+ symporter
MSGASFVGLIGASYTHGLVVFNYEWTAAAVLIVFAMIMLPVFFRLRLFTVPEYLEVRFDRRARLAYAALTLFTLLFIDIAGALYAGGVVITTVFPGLALWETSAMIALLAGTYTLIGGLRAVVITDAAQGVLMIVGASAICFFGLEAVGGWDALMTGLTDAQRRLIAPADDGFLPWPGIFGVILLGFYYWTLNQYFVQRALAAKSLDHGRKGALFGGLLKLPNVFLMIVPGMLAAVLLPNLANPDQAFPKLAFELLPIGFRGLILTALVAAIMSSLDSALNAASSLLTMDFVRPFRPNLSNRALLGIGRGFTALLMIVAACYAPIIESFGSLFGYFQSTLAYLVPPIVGVYLAGLLSKRCSRRSGFHAIAISLAVGVPLFLFKEVSGGWAIVGLPDIHFTYMATAMFALSLAIVAISSVFATTREAAPTEAVFQLRDLGSGDIAPGKRRNYQVYVIGLIILLVVCIISLLP